MLLNVEDRWKSEKIPPRYRVDGSFCGGIRCAAGVENSLLTPCFQPHKTRRLSGAARHWPSDGTRWKGSSPKGSAARGCGRKAGCGSLLLPGRSRLVTTKAVPECGDRGLVRSSRSTCIERSKAPERAHPTAEKYPRLVGENCVFWRNEDELLPYRLESMRRVRSALAPCRERERCLLQGLRRNAGGVSCTEGTADATGSTAAGATAGDDPRIACGSAGLRGRCTMSAALMVLPRVWACAPQAETGSKRGGTAAAGGVAV